MTNYKLKNDKLGSLIPSTQCKSEQVIQSHLLTNSLFSTLSKSYLDINLYDLQKSSKSHRLKSIHQNKRFHHFINIK
jgi:hypothetical protein